MMPAFATCLYPSSIASSWIPAVVPSVFLPSLLLVISSIMVSSSSSGAAAAASVSTCRSLEPFLSSFPPHYNFMHAPDRPSCISPIRFTVASEDSGLHHHYLIPWLLGTSPSCSSPSYNFLYTPSHPIQIPLNILSVGSGSLWTSVDHQLQLLTLATISQHTTSCMFPTSLFMSPSTALAFHKQLTYYFQIGNKRRVAFSGSSAPLSIIPPYRSICFFIGRFGNGGKNTEHKRRICFLKNSIALLIWQITRSCH